MKLSADPQDDWKGWDFLVGTPDQSIIINRFNHLRRLDEMSENTLQIAAKDITNPDGWTKWVSFPGLLRQIVKDTWEWNGRNYHRYNNSLSTVYDIHRSILKNEIVIESDYPTYEQNAEAMKTFGQILEHYGFVPNYYYSGNKSIHTNIFLDFDWFADNVDGLLIDQVKQIYSTESTFIKAVMNWLRGYLISGFGTEIRTFDPQFIKSDRKMIRSELSRNKLGYKTFIGYGWKDISPIPPISNEINQIYPRLGEIKLSQPSNPNKIISEFLAERTKSKKIKAIKQRESLGRWLDKKQEGLRDCIKFILSDSFKVGGDGKKRAIWILINDLKRLYGTETAFNMVKEWRDKVGCEFTDEQIRYRLNTQDYYLSCNYIHEFIRSLGFKTDTERFK